MKIDLFIPPAVDDIDWSSGYLVRCKPENDCASLFGPGTGPGMYTALARAFRDAQAHAKTCPHEHAVVVIARGPASVEGGCGCQSPRPDGQGASREPGKPSSTEPLLVEPC